MIFLLNAYTSQRMLKKYDGKKSNFNIQKVKIYYWIIGLSRKFKIDENCVIHDLNPYETLFNYLCLVLAWEEQ